MASWIEIVRRGLRTVAACAVVLSISGLAACGGNSTDDPGATKVEVKSGGTQAGTGPVERGGDATVALSTAYDTLDPHVTALVDSFTVSRNVAETLLRPGAEVEYLPGLATKWSVDSGGAVDLTLREGVTFADGTPFNAEAVKFNLDRIVDPETKSAVGRDFIGGANYTGTEVVGRYRVRITYKTPYGAVLAGLASPALSMLSPTAIKSNKPDPAKQPVGTGPYVVKTVSKTEVVLEKRDDYNGPGKAGNLDSITFRFTTEPSTRLGLLESGQAQMAREIPPQDAGRLKGSGADVLVIEHAGSPRSFYLNTAAPPTDDIAVRKAMLQGIDRKQIVETALFGFSGPEFGPMSKPSLGYDPAVEELYPHDIAAAEKTLEDAGWNKGADGIRSKAGTLAEVTLAVNFVNDRIAELFQDQMKKVGIDVQLSKSEYSVGFEQMLKDKLNMFPDAYLTIDPAINVGCYWDSANEDACNLSSFTSKQLDRAIAKGRQSAELATREAAYSDVQRIIMENALIIPIDNFSTLFGVKGLERAVIYQDDTVDFAAAGLSK